MTLIIAGHEQAADPWQQVWAQSDAVGDKKLAKDGLFAVADSVITIMGSGGLTPILSGHRKIHGIPIKLWKPYFVCEYFQSYPAPHFETECFMAFAGSTLTASHSLNMVTEHLSQLRISYSRTSTPLTPGSYIVQRHCEYNILEDPKASGRWAEDMFLDSDIEGLLTAEYISQVVEHSLNKAVESARKHRLSEDSFRNMHTDFMLGVHCPKNDTHHLFTYRMRAKLVAGVYEPYMERAEVGPEKVAVLGLRKDFEAPAQAAMDTALSSGRSTGEAMFSFLNEAITEVTATGSLAIDRPAIHKHFKSGRLKKEQFARET
jgi:hypothetical protein